MTKNQLSAEQVKALMGPLNSNRVAHRNQGGRELSYLEAWDVKATLTRIFGFANWSSETTDTRILREHWYPSPNDASKELVKVTALCTVRLTILLTGAVYQESAAASQSGPDHGEVVDFAIKTAESDALKRAATPLGTQFGLGLYDKGSLREVIRVLIEPIQAAYLLNPDSPQEATGADLSAGTAAVLNHSLGATIASEEPAQPAGMDTRTLDEVATPVESDGPQFDRKIDTPNAAKDAVEAMTANAEAKKARSRR